MQLTSPRRIPPHAVDRPALRAQLDLGLASPLSLIVAPAGAGKTVLLSQWAHSRPDVAVAWLDISSADADAARFARRLIDGIAAVSPDFTAPTRPVPASGGRLGDAFLEELAHGLADAGTITLVFDDLDRMPSAELLGDVWRLTELLPATAHAVFCSRVDLQLGWSRHRLDHGLVEIRQRELAFGRDTTARVLSSITGRAVSDELAEAVTARTEGWAAGVQLTALSLRSADDPERIVSELADTDRLIAEYLSTEVLDAMARERRTAITSLAVLDELCVDLVAVVADTPGREFIDALERDSLFLVPISGRPGWYRFHRLFRSLLLYRLRADDRRAEERILRTAADWYLAEGVRDTAVEYLLRAHSWDRVLDEALNSGREVYDDVRTATVASWLSRVPSEVRASRRNADLLLAITEGVSGRSAAAADGLQSLIASTGLSIGQRQIALTYFAAGVQFQSHASAFAEASQQSLSFLREHPEAEPPDLMGVTSRSTLILTSQVSLGRALLLLGRLDDAYDALIAAHDPALLTYTPYRVHSLGSLALVEALTGRLVAAAAHADEALEATREFDLVAHPASADAYLAHAMIAIQRGEPDAGAVALFEGRTRAAHNHRHQLEWVAYLAAQLIEPADLSTVAVPSGPAPDLVRAELTALGLRRARSSGASSTRRTTSVDGTPLAFEEVCALLAAGDAPAASARLAHFASSVDDRSPRTAVELDLLSGWLCTLQRRRAQAQQHLGAALSRAQPEQLVDPFARVGSPIIALLAEAPGGGSDFGRLIAERVRPKASPTRDVLVDALTPRELELVHYLPTRLTIAEIAAQWFLSTNTVKTHFAHVYRKLGVSGRDAAIARAEELGLLGERS